MSSETIELLIALFTVSGLILGPTIWMFRQSMSSVSTKMSQHQLETTTKTNELTAALKEFRDHFDSKITDVHMLMDRKISEMYLNVDIKNRDLKEWFSRELESVLNMTASIERKIDSTKEHTHQVEKDLLRLQGEVGKDYITKTDLERLLRTKSED